MGSGHSAFDVWLERAIARSCEKAKPLEMSWEDIDVGDVTEKRFWEIVQDIDDEINALGTVMIFLTVGLPLLGLAIARRMAMQRGG